MERWKQSTHSLMCDHDAQACEEGGTQSSFKTGWLPAVVQVNSN